MPLFYQHNINETTKLGIWDIREGEDFFLHKVPLQHNVSHPHKRLQHLAGRYLLQFLFPGFPYELIKIADTRKPFLTNEAFHFSISHCGHYAAALVSKFNRVGVDIEMVKPMIEKLKYKFLSEDEITLLLQRNARLQPGLPNFKLQPSNSKLLTPDSRLLTILWSAKESLFKWFGNGEVDFKQHMQIHSINGNMLEGQLVCTFRKKFFSELIVRYLLFDDLVLAWVVT